MHRWVSVIELQLSNARTRSAFRINWSLRSVLLWGFSGGLYLYQKNAECLWCKWHPIQDCWNIWAESFVAYSTQPLDSSQWIKKIKRVANLNSFFKNKVNLKILILFICPKRHFHWLWTSCNSSKSNLPFLLAKGFNLKISAFISPAVEDWINNTSLTAVFGLQKLSQIPVLWICLGKWKH